MTIKNLTPKAIELFPVRKGRFVCMGSASAGSLEWSGKVYERVGNTFVKVSDRDPIATECARSKFHLVRAPVFHCPGWLALDASVNALSLHVYTIAVRQHGGLRKVAPLDFMNMDIAIRWVLKSLAEGEAPSDIAVEHGHLFERMMKSNEDLTGHEALEQRAEIIRLIASIGAAYKLEEKVQSETPVRKRRRRGLEGRRERRP